MGQVLGGVALYKKLPNGFSSLKLTKLQTDGWGVGVAEPNDYLMVLAVPILKALLEFVLSLVFVLGRCWNRANNIVPKLAALEEARHSLGPSDIVGALEDHSDRFDDVASYSPAPVVSSEQNFDWLALELEQTGVIASSGSDSSDTMLNNKEK
ncbi:hypothetical protein Acr_16g0001990 [Actinidia rufa]|uniref:Uncharacterized protein n=1 Tax=Actinidia rufa TaxID=165716 RepID=A0A7J0FY15_9ERIC|nr:hypothetical protein Acr_16g0001990 [Actinidia rufa]